MCCEVVAQLTAAQREQVETLHADYRQCLREEEVLYDNKTDHQRLRVIENAKFGRVLTLDRCAHAAHCATCC